MSSISAYDVVVVGGGAAGLSAAVALARSLRSVVVVDAGEPRNAPAGGAHNLLGREGIPPLELLAAGRREAEQYGAEILRDRAVTARAEEEGFTVGLAGGGVLRARRLLLATGLVDELPDVPGVAELWGRSVLHCPYCHGWEVRGRRIGVLGAGPMSIHQTLLFRQLSEDVTFFPHRMPDPGPEAWEQLSALGIRVVEGPVQRLRTDGDVLRAVVLADGQEVPVDALVVAPRFAARAELYEQLGGTLTDHPAGTLIATGPMGSTDVPGVWAAGNAGDLSAMVSAAAGAGVGAAAAINADLVAEEAAAAVRARAQGAAAGTPRRG
ncbi:NAD(P)/FAD-dependent oxidoreductase [Kocuria rosea]|uniref:NAD(P)/FAD-dependent oxidoreductase n=1 Tax=Kocuria rosea TaxID=1275 RepID=UPI00254147A7|nr:NAD(P)/FAD-dependent oxidoreductase [Kocuria rosea]WIG17572.1 NAD(P)/FAD-dependent oxidoreductase [Kocuria rosea]